MNAIELKGNNDSLTLEQYYTILGRAFGFAAHRERDTKKDHFLLSQMTVIMLCITLDDILAIWEATIADSGA